MERVEEIDFEEDRYCPVFNRGIDCEYCYEALLGISRGRKREAVRELDELSDDEVKRAYSLCKACKYSEL